MAPRQKGKKKTARSSDGDNEEGIDQKRQCTTSTRTTTSTTTSSVSVKKGEEEVNVNSQDKMIISFEACIDILSQLKLYDGPIVSSILRRVFNILFYIITKSHVVDKKHFQNENIFSKCLDVFRKDGIWGDRNEAITDAAIDLFDCCRIRKLLEDSDDYEMILPFLAVGVKKFGSNQHSNEILANTLTLIHKACGSIQDKKIIERSGVMESLSVLLASNDSDEDQKKKIRKVIVKIAAP